MVFYSGRSNLNIGLFVSLSVCLSVCLSVQSQMHEENGVKFYLSAGVKEMVGENGKVPILTPPLLHLFPSFSSFPPIPPPPLSLPSPCPSSPFPLMRVTRMENSIYLLTQWYISLAHWCDSTLWGNAGGEICIAGVGKCMCQELSFKRKGNSCIICH